MTSQKLASDIPLTANTVIVASPEQVSSDLADESVILNLKTGTYFGLNAVGSRIWQLAQEPQRVGTLCEAILAEYEIDAETCDRDVKALLQEMLGAQLIEIQDEPGS